MSRTLISLPRKRFARVSGRGQAFDGGKIVAVPFGQSGAPWAAVLAHRSGTPDLTEAIRTFVLGKGHERQGSAVPDRISARPKRNISPVTGTRMGDQ